MANDPQAIAPVVLWVSTTLGGRGRIERFTQASRLMLRFEQISRRELKIQMLTEGGTLWPVLGTLALNNYLGACLGLTYFRRICAAWRTRAAWHQFRDLFGVPPIAPTLSSPHQHRRRK